jgi:anti-sigma-K factor RskA
MKPSPEELAGDYVLDHLDPNDRAAFEARLPGDPQLAELVRDLEAAVERRIHALPQHVPPVDLLARIEAQLGGPATSEAPANGRVSNFGRWAAVARWGLAAVIAVSLATLAIQSLRHAPATDGPTRLLIVGLDAGGSRLAELPWNERSQDADSRFIQMASLAEKYWEKPGELPVKLAAAGRTDRGYALYDPGTNQGFIAIEQLPAAEPGRRYHLWMIDTVSGLAREAGVLPLNGEGRGLYFFSFAPAPATAPGRPDFFVTSEDTAGPEATQPRGEVVLGEKRI